MAKPTPADRAPSNDAEPSAFARELRAADTAAGKQQAPAAAAAAAAATAAPATAQAPAATPSPTKPASSPAPSSSTPPASHAGDASATRTPPTRHTGSTPGEQGARHEADASGAGGELDPSRPLHRVLSMQHELRKRLALARGEVSARAQATGEETGTQTPALADAALGDARLRSGKNTSDNPRDDASLALASAAPVPSSAPSEPAPTAAPAAAPAATPAAALGHAGAAPATAARAEASLDALTLAGAEGESAACAVKGLSARQPAGQGVVADEGAAKDGSAALSPTHVLAARRTDAHEGAAGAHAERAQDAAAAALGSSAGTSGNEAAAATRTATGPGSIDAMPSFAAELARAGHGTNSTHGAAQDAARADASQISLKEPLQSPEFMPRLGGELVLLAKNGVHEARVQIHPAELGPIAVQITLDGQAAQVRLSVDNALTRDLLEQGMPTLAAALHDSGLTLTGGGVFQQARDSAREGQTEEHGTRRETPAGDSTAQASVPATTATRRVRHPGRVDVYA